MSLFDFGFLRRHNKKNAGRSSSSSHEKRKRKGGDKDSTKKKSRSEDSFEDGLANFQKILDKHELKPVDVPRDGNCFFHALSHQLELRGEYFSHTELRRNTVKYMNKLKREYPDNPVSTLIDESYLGKMSEDGTWVDHLAIQSLAQHMKVNIKIFTSLTGMHITHIDGGGDSNAPLLLGHIFESHYLSLVSVSARRPTVAARSPTSVDSQPEPAGPVPLSRVATADKPAAGAASVDSLPCSPEGLDFDLQDNPDDPSPLPCEPEGPLPPPSEPDGISQSPSEPDGPLPQPGEPRSPSPPPCEPDCLSQLPCEPDGPLPPPSERSIPSPPPSEPGSSSPPPREPGSPSPPPCEPGSPSPPLCEPDGLSQSPSEPDSPSPPPSEPDSPSPPPSEPSSPSPPPVLETRGKSYSQGYRPQWEQKQWAKGWLTKDNQGSAYCKLCLKKLTAKLSVLKDHVNTVKHKSLNGNKSSGSLPMYYTSFTSQAEAELNLVAMLARKNVSFSFADDLLATLKHIDPKSKIIQGLHCGRSKVQYLLTECLAPSAHANLVERLKASQGFSILCDKATDVTAEQTFSISVRFFEDGEPITRFYRLIKVGLQDGCAAGIFRLLDEALKEDSLDWHKVIGFASDGENLMQGSSNSVVTNVKAKAPQVFVVKCFCHTFHLISSYACQHISKTAEQFVHDVYNFFKTSSKRKQKFEQIQMALNVAPHRLLKPAQTRWLSLHMCVHRIIEQWNVLYAFFEGEMQMPTSTHNPTAVKLFYEMKKKTVLATLQFMDYILPEFTVINKVFQSDTFQLHRLLPEVRRIIRSLSMNFMQERFVVNLSDNQVPNFRREDTYKPIESIYPGESAHNTSRQMLPHERETFLTRCREFFIEVIHQILERIDLDDRVLHHLQFLAPEKLRSGRASVSTGNVLASRFPTFADRQTIDRQWRSLLHEQSLIKDMPLKIDEFWKALSHHESYLELAKFVGVLFALPQSSASVERTFSLVGLNKTKLRNRLGVSTVEAILQVSQFYTEPFRCSKSLEELHKGAYRSYCSKYSSQDREHQEEEDGAPLSFE